MKVVWVVESAFAGGNIHYRIFNSEIEARNCYDSIDLDYKNIYKTKDIWGNALD